MGAVWARTTASGFWASIEDANRRLTVSLIFLQFGFTVRDRSVGRWVFRSQTRRRGDEQSRAIAENVI